MWSIFPTNLLISQNVLAWSDYALETYSNKELIGINQDKLGSPAKRIVGKAIYNHSTFVFIANSSR